MQGNTVLMARSCSSTKLIYFSCPSRCHFVVVVVRNTFYSLLANEAKRHSLLKERKPLTVLWYEKFLYGVCLLDTFYVLVVSIHKAKASQVVIVIELVYLVIIVACTSK